jgi:hypothetical protein
MASLSRVERGGAFYQTGRVLPVAPVSFAASPLLGAFGQAREPGRRTLRSAQVGRIKFP